jgi:hypothetical protein
MTRDAGNERVGYELYGICGTRVFSQFIALEVKFAVPLAQLHIFNNCAESNGVPQERLFFAREADAFGVATAFHVKNAVITPAQDAELTLQNQSNM